jgi:Zn-dependent protease with chaperone function
MDFFHYQEQARRRTVLLVVLYGLSLMAITALVYAVMTLIVTSIEQEAPALIWKPDLFFWTFVGVLGVIGLGTLYKVVQLSRGGEVVAAMLGGRPIRAETSDPRERRLVNIVEEMALASGTPMPKVFVLDREPGINAFAAGLSTRDAVVAVTRGALEKLNRDELQGVIAHEFSHIHNGDMRLNLRLMGILHGILLLSLLGYYTMRITGDMAGRGRGSGRGGKQGGVVVLVFFLIGLALWIIGSMGVLFAHLIRSAVSRQREFLADAAAVQFTRNPAGLAQALKKIGAMGSKGAMQAERAQEASHLFFAGGLRAGLFNLFSTHPPLVQRIRRLDPTFTGRFDPALLTPSMAPAVEVPPVAELAAVSALREGRAARVPVKPLGEQTGTFSSAALQTVTAFLKRLPPSLRRAFERPAEAPAVIWALLWAAAQERGEERYGEWIEEAAGPLIRPRAEALLPTITQIPRAGWYVVAAAAVPALREMAPEAYRHFRDAVQNAIEADDRVTLFEYTMLRFLMRRLDGHFGLARPRSGGMLRLESAREECAVLLGTLARMDETQEARAAAAFSEGWEVLQLGEAALPPAGSCTLAAADQALERLSQLRPAAKQKVLDACGRCAGYDGAVTVDEADFLCAVADALECPLPPLALTALMKADQAAAKAG